MDERMFKVNILKGRATIKCIVCNKSLKLLLKTKKYVETHNLKNDVLIEFIAYYPTFIDFRDYMKYDELIETIQLNCN